MWGDGEAISPGPAGAPGSGGRGQGGCRYQDTSSGKGAGAKYLEGNSSTHNDSLGGEESNAAAPLCYHGHKDAE